MLATLAVVLALAGAPASTRVECDPGLPSTIELGLTVSNEAQLIDGRVIMGPLDRIILGPLACGALLYTSASPQERAAIRRLNPGTDFDQLVGVGLQVALHEAEHVALDSADECVVEKSARTKINSLLMRVADPARVAGAESAATFSDAGLPQQYHNC